MDEFLDDSEGSDALAGGSDRLTLIERATDFTSRHRLLSAALSVAVLAACVGTWAYVSTRPPPVDETIGVTFVGTDNSPSMSDESARVISQPIQMFVTDSTSTYVVHGMVGPGLRNAQTSNDPASTGEGQPPDQIIVTAQLDCADPRLKAPVSDDYGVAVSKTDQWGRSIDATAPIVSSLTPWSDVVTGACVRIQGPIDLKITSAQLISTPASTAFSLKISIFNNGKLPYITTVNNSRAELNLSTGEPAVLNPQASTVLVADGSILDCTWDLANNPLTRLDLLIKLGASNEDIQLPLPEKFLNEMSDHFDSSCNGLPAFDYSIGPVSGIQTNAIMNTRVPVVFRTKADSVQLIEANLAPNTVPARPMRVRNGTATIALVLQFECTSASYFAPIATTVSLSANGRRYPVQLTLTDQRILTPLRKGCDNPLSPEVAESYGWAPLKAR